MEASGDGSREGLGAQIVARNLVNLVNGSQAGDLASLEEVVASLVKDTMDPEKESVLDLEVRGRWCGVRGGLFLCGERRARHGRRMIMLVMRRAHTAPT